MVSVGVVSRLACLLVGAEGDCTEKCLTILYNLSSIEEGRAIIADTEGCIGAIADLLDTRISKFVQKI